MPTNDVTARLSTVSDEELQAKDTFQPNLDGVVANSVYELRLSVTPMLENALAVAESTHP